MNIHKLALEHPGLLVRILVKSSGAIGEILVADRLTSFGYVVEPTNNNARQHDLTARRPDGEPFRVEVKTVRVRGAHWFVRRRPDPGASAVWVMVSAPRLPEELPPPNGVEMFVITAEEARQLWDANPWNQRHPENGDLRRTHMPADACEAWHKLPDWPRTPARSPE